MTAQDAMAICQLKLAVRPCGGDLMVVWPVVPIPSPNFPGLRYVGPTEAAAYNDWAPLSPVCVVDALAKLDSEELP